VIIPIIGLCILTPAAITAFVLAVREMEREHRRQEGSHQ
jgi:hypothetical protein